MLSQTSMHDEEELPGILRANRLLCDLEPSELQAVRESIKALRYEHDELIIREGDRNASAYYVLASGRVRVFSWRTGPSPIRELHIPGEGFGELALIHDAPRSASCRAVVGAELM